VVKKVVVAQGLGDADRQEPRQGESDRGLMQPAFSIIGPRRPGRARSCLYSEGPHTVYG
jgi:hypothetical protein